MAGAPTTQTKRQQQGEASRADILDAASRLMSAKGYDGTSMADLAAESGLPASSIYWHFSSKRGVLGAVMERGAERFFADAPSEAKLEAVAPRDRLRMRLHHSSKVMPSHPEFLRLFLLLLLQSDPVDQEVVHRVREAGRVRINNMLRECFSEYDAATARKIAGQLTDYAQGIFDGAFIATQYDPKLSHRKLMDQMTDTLLALGDAIAR